MHAMVQEMMRLKEDGHLMEHLDWCGVSLDILAENFGGEGLTKSRRSRSTLLNTPALS